MCPWVCYNNYYVPRGVPPCKFCDIFATVTLLQHCGNHATLWHLYHSDIYATLIIKSILEWSEVAKLARELQGKLHATSAHLGFHGVKCLCGPKWTEMDRSGPKWHRNCRRKSVWPTLRTTLAITISSSEIRGWPVSKAQNGPWRHIGHFWT